MDQMQLSLPEEVRLGSCPLPERARAMETNASTWRLLLKEDRETAQTRQQVMHEQSSAYAASVHRDLVQDSPTVQRGVTKASPGRPWSPCESPSLPEKGQQRHARGRRDHGDHVFPLLLCAQDYPA